MNKLTLLVPPSQVDNVSIVIEPCIYGMSDTYYLVPTGFSLETIAGLKRHIQELEVRCERRLKGLEYWKTKNLKNDETLKLAQIQIDEILRMLK